MARQVFSSLCFAVLLKGMLGEDAACEADDGACEADSDQFSTLQLLSSRVVGRELTQAEWETEYDFIVHVKMGGGCTGFVWKDMVLTAAHCALQTTGEVITARQGTISATLVGTHPDWEGKSKVYDFALLRLADPAQNTQRAKLQAADKIREGGFPNGLNLAGFGKPTKAALPRLTENLATRSCGGTGQALCTSSGDESEESGCSGDSGGPWFEWEYYACSQKDNPRSRKSRECAIYWGQGSHSNGYAFADGTGTWCSIAKGAFKGSLEAAMHECATGNFQGFPKPCVGVVFNANKPGDEGYAYTTCWKKVATGVDWQVLLKPLSTSVAVLPLPAPKTAIVAGVTSFGRGPSCPSTRTETGSYKTSDARDWIEDVAPGHFEWTAYT